MTDSQHANMTDVPPAAKKSNPVLVLEKTYIADSAGPVGYDDPDRPRGPVLCPLLRRCSE